MTNSKPVNKTVGQIQEWLRQEIARALSIPAENLDASERFHRLGLDSTRVSGVIDALATRLERPLSPILFWKYPTLDALSSYLADGAETDEDKAAKQENSGQAAIPFDAPIAIVGIGCRFPGGSDSAERFWELLRTGRDAICDIPADRWNHETYFDEDYTACGKMNTRRGGFLDHVDKFDPLFFGITPSEAAQMDPQQRLMLELSWEAIEDAGLIPASLRDSRTGVFFGLAFNDYSIIKNRIGVEGITAHTTAGSIASIVSNRVSYCLGLQGPSMSLDTACSSSLVAVHLACQSLRTGESTLALAGGVNLMLAPDTAISLSQLGALSPDGKCRAFDAGANGFVRAEGGGVVVIKRLSDAVRDGDPVYCVIRGSAVNNDGASNGLTAPNPRAQESVIREACRNAGIDPVNVHYVETHGTGTPIGDPIEAASLGAVYGSGRTADRPLLVGSVKTNIGHLEAAAGMTGLIKVALSLKHSLLTPNLHFQQPSSHIDFDRLRLRVVTELQPWPVSDGERRLAAVSAFGLGGTNGHVVLEGVDRPKRLLFVAGDDTAGLQVNVGRALEAIRADEKQTYQLARMSIKNANRPHRFAILSESANELTQQLEGILSNKYSKGVYRAAECVEYRRDPVWVFSGVGSQWLGMGRCLMSEEPIFRATLERCGHEIKRRLGWSLLDELTASAGQSRLDRIDVLWPTLFAIQVGLVSQWRSFGIKPAAVIGHSLGEVAAAYAAGVLTLEEGASVACHWGLLAERARGNGGMAIVGLGWEATSELIVEFGEEISCGVNASPNTTVLSGEISALDTVVKRLTEQGIFARRIAVTIAAHTSRMEPFVEELPRLLGDVRPSKASVPFVSTNTGQFTSGEELDGHYWRRQLCEPVRFAQGISQLIDAGHNLFLECSPHPAVHKAIEECLSNSGKTGMVVASLFREEHEGNALREALATLYVQGSTIDADSTVNGNDFNEEERSNSKLLLLPISGRKEQARRDYARSLGEFIENAENVPLTDICYTASVRRTFHPYRATVVARNRDEFVKGLKAIAEGERGQSTVSAKSRTAQSTSIAFIFPGQGSQWRGMARQLIADEPVFRSSIEECALAIHKYTDWSLTEELFADDASSRLDRVDVVQPALFAIAVGLCALWRSWGVTPSAVVGHSMGEVAASYIAGALTLDNAARIICLRSQLLRRVSGQGAMAVTELPRQQAEQYLVGFENRVSIAVCNSPNSTVLSGDPAALDEILAALESKEIFCRKVKVDVASHSPQMEPLREDLLAALSGLEPSPGTVPIYSTVNGEVCDGAGFDPSYWADNLRKPVQFVGAIEALLEVGYRTFVEISPHPLLTGNVREIMKYRGIAGLALSSLRREEDDHASLLSGLATLHCFGHSVDFARLYPEGGRVVALPAYAWQRERHWVKPIAREEVAAQIALQCTAPSREFESQIGSTEEAMTLRASSPNSIYFHNEWGMASLDQDKVHRNVEGSTLVLGDDDDTLRYGRASLSSEAAPVVLVMSGQGYRDCGELTYEIDPNKAGDYSRLFEELALQNLLPSRIIYYWSDRRTALDHRGLEKHLGRGIYSLLYLSQALDSIRHKTEIRLWYVFQTIPNEVLPQHAALSGAFKTLRQENPGYIYKTVEIRTTSEESCVRQCATVWGLMKREVLEKRDEEFEVRYEGGVRYARHLQEVQLEDRTRPEAHRLSLKKGGVYLITGGAGGLGLIFAEHLARQQQVKIVLSGRSSLNAVTQATIDRLNSFGSEVVYMQGDIARREQALKLVDEIKSRFGPIDGVLHVAGVLNRTFFAKKSPEDVASVLAPKVYGTLNLDDVLKDEPLEFFILFSSISAVKGYEGLFDYAYGNSFMDHFAEWRENLRASGKRVGRCVSINWSLWQDGGMQLAPAEAELFLEQTGLEVLTVPRGTRLLDVCATQLAVNQCLVGYGDRVKFAEFLRPNSALECGITEPSATIDEIPPFNSTLNIDPDLFRQRVEDYLKTKLAEVTGLQIDEFDAQERFVAYGIDSVIVHRFNAKIARDLGPVSKTLLFENKNIEELTSYFAANHIAALVRLFGMAAKPVVGIKEEENLAALPTPASDTTKVRKQTDGEARLEDDIAIIGIGGRYPRARNLDEFWQILKSGSDCIDEIRVDRWDYHRFYDGNPEKSADGKTYSKWGGLLEDVDKFDPLFFSISMKEAQSMDPQERLFLETSWTAFEDAGYSRTRLRRYVENTGGVDVGVFVGCTSNTYMLLGPAEWDAGNYTLPLSMPWSIANRVSHLLDLHGPSLPVDTGCASSLTAIHLACESLKRGESSMALAGGVNLVLHPSKFFYPSQYRMLSPTGRCRAFGQDADGIVLGEGVGAVVLKPLREAVKDGDNIYAVIKGTASNHGGHAHGYTVPNPHAQSELILRSLNNAGIGARSISCIEAHGTGTSLGDPIEVSGLTKAFRTHTGDKQYCVLGSVKSNIGHLEGAAGIAGLTKLLLQFKHRQFAPSLHAETLNTDINFEETPFCVRSELTEWKRPVIDVNGESKIFPRRAGVSSFGAGGSNAHVLLEEYEDDRTVSTSSDDSKLFLISANSEERLRVYASNLVDFLAKPSINTGSESAVSSDLADIAYTLQVGREAMEERLAVLANSREELVAALSAFLSDDKTSNECQRASAVKHLTSIKARQEWEETISGWLERGHLAMLMEAWLKGREIDWTRLSQNVQRRIVSLPTYPYLKERVWIHDREILCEGPNADARNQVRFGLHPLLDSNESTLSEQRFKKLLIGDEFFLRDHRVGAHLVLPGVAIVEMARAAGEIAAERKVQKISNIVFSRPVSISNEPQEFYVGLRPKDNSVDFEIYNLSGDSGRSTYAQGKLEYGLQGATDVEPQRIDIAAIQMRCLKRVNSAGGYALLHNLGLQLGASFQPVGEIHCSDTEAISRLELPAHLENEFNAFVLHPSLLDGAQQVAGLTKLLGPEDRVRVPFAIGEIEIHQPLTRVCYAHVILSGGSGALHTENRKFDIWLADESGQVLVTIKRFQTREFIAQQSSKPVGLSLRSDDTIAGPYCFWSNWEPSSFLSAENARSLNGTILVFDTGDQVRDILRTRLQQVSNEGVNVILVKPGEHYRSFGDQGYTIDPKNADDYKRLFAGLQSRERMPDSIIHLWSRTPFRAEQETLAAQLHESIYSVFHISQALLNSGLSKQVRVLYGYFSGAGGPQPQYAALSGFFSTLQRESSRLICTALEFAESQEAPEHGSVPDRVTTELVEKLLSELRSPVHSGLEVRYANGKRYAHRFEEVYCEDVVGTPDNVTRVELRENGVYLLTGGLGGLGLVFAKFLARNYKANLVLAGRSDISAEQEVILDELRAIGGEAIYSKADVSRRDEALTLVASIKERFGRIDGVIHSAGVTRDAFVRNKTLEEMEAVLAPKVFGAIYLDEALANEPVEVFALFSSTTAHLGQMGQSDYGYANRFMDNFAFWREHERLAGRRHGKSISINWPLWRDGGMRLDEQTEELLFTSTGMKAMTTEAGLRAFEVALAQQQSQLFVIDGDHVRIKKTLDLISDTQTIVQRTDPLPDSESDNEQIPILQTDLLKTVASILKISEARIGIDKNFSDYGFDSVSLVEFSNQLNRKFKLEITPAIFFEFSSIRAFSRHLQTEYSEAVSLRYRIKNAVAQTAVTPAQIPRDTNRNEAQDRRFWPATAETLSNRFADAGSEEARPNSITREPIAIIGMSGILPQSEDLEAFWNHLEAKHNLITEIPKERWDWRACFGNPNEEANKTNVKWGGFFKDVDKFDAKFFGISRREAEFMDPQQRIFLEVVWRAIEDAGYKASELAGRKVGVFAGVAGLDYGELMRDSGVEIEAYSTTGVFHCILANRVSYLLNITGPSVPVDTGCSSALVAIRQAIEAIWSGSCEMAIAGGINVLLSPSVFISFSKAGMLSVDGKCKTFDKSANGYVRAEGAGVVLLKPLSRAIADRDNIHAIIRGSAVNHGGKVNTLTAPNPNAQAELIKSAFAEGEIHPSTVSYIEAHGTGTSLGDPIEINGLKKAFREMFLKCGLPAPDKAFCGVGSVKTNTGHLETAAAMAGIFKVILAMKHNKIPASIHFKEVNPYVELENSPLYLVTESKVWERQVVNGVEIPRRAGVSSFGFGGVSGHLVLEEYISHARDENEVRSEGSRPQIIVLSARNEERLKAYAVRMAEFLGTEGEPAIPPRFSFPTNGNLLPILQKELLRMASLVVDLNEEDIYLDESFTEWGLNLVHLNQLVELVAEEFGVNLDSTNLLEHPSLGALATHLWSAYRDRIMTHFLTRREREGLRPTLANIAYTLQVGREAMPERIAFVASTIPELVEKMMAYSQGSGEGVDFFKGNADRNNSPFEFVMDGIEGREFIQMLVSSRKLRKLAQLWVSGVDLDWNALNHSNAIQRISLPTYPFARDRYWFSDAKHKAQSLPNKAIHPLIDRLDLSLSMQDGLAFIKTLSRTEPIVAHHNVGGKLVLPGVAHLAMALAAVSKIKEANSFELSRVLWLRPLVIDNDSHEVRLVVREENGMLPFELQSNWERETVTHSTGTLIPTFVQVAAEHLSIDKIKGRCDVVLDKQELYRMFSRTGVTLGAYFQTLEQAWMNRDEILARLHLSADYEGEAKDYYVHPTMMDAALQAMGRLWLARHSDNHAPLLPFAIEKAEFLRPLGGSGYVYVSVSGEHSFNAELLDEQGLTCIKLHEVTLREAKEKSAPSPEGFYFRPAWKVMKTDSVDLNPTINHDNIGERRHHPAKVLIVHPFEDLGLSGALRQAHANDEVFEILLGNENRQLSDSRWETSCAGLAGEFNCTVGMQPIDQIYFMGGIRPFNEHSEDLANLAQSQEQGVISLFRLVKSLSQRGVVQSRLGLTVITNDVHQVLPGESIQPFAASLFGCVKSLSKEYPRWKVNCIDIRQEEADRPEIMRAVLSQVSGNGSVVALRDGRQYMRIIQRVELPASEELKFRPGGVYLILGGAGGIGLELSKYLAGAVQARLVLVGRGDLSKEQRSQIEAIESLGGSVLYVRADATDLASMRGAVEQAKARFGQIHGVIHSALVLRDKTVEMMSEEEFRAAMLPKVQGSVNLHLAVAGEPLDFMLFFSSAQSFSGNAGQSNYAAGCTFKDAFAEYLRQVSEYEVKTINWGYWGEVGVVASAEYNRRLAAQGVSSISVGEGMDAVRRVLNNSVDHVLALHADDQVLELMGAELDHEIEVYPTRHNSIIGVASGQTNCVRMETGEFELSIRAFDEVERFGELLLLKMFQRMGVFRKGGERYDKEALKRFMGIVPAYSRLAEVMLGILAKAGFVQLEGALVSGTSEIGRSDLQIELKELAAKKAQLVSTYPRKTAHLNLLFVCMENAPRVLTGEIPATDVVFPNSSTELVTGIYKNNLSADYFNHLVVANLKSYIEERLPSLSEGEKITILEVGAGIGGTSALIFETLSQFSKHLRYFYTDISLTFTRYGKKQYGENNPYVEFKLLDIERDVEIQDFEAGSCDVVIATNVLHATRSVRRSLGRVKHLLKKNGWLVVNEGTSVQNFASLTFGLLEGWWLFEDEENRIPGSPLLDSNNWSRLLKEEGFGQVAIQGQLDTNGRGLGQNVLVAESDGLVRRERRISIRASKTLADSPGRQVESLKPIEPRPAKLWKEASLDVGRHSLPFIDVRQYIQSKIVEILADVLQLEREELNLNTAYTNLGVDSILSVEIVNRLNKESGIELRGTDLFNYSTILSLTEHVVKSFGTEIKRRLEASMSLEPRIDTAYPEDRESENILRRQLPATSPFAERLPESTKANLFPTFQTQAAATMESEGQTNVQPDRSIEYSSTAVAVIGMAGRFPEAENVQEFWTNLAAGRNSIHEAARWDINQLYDPDPRMLDKSYGKWAGLLSGIELFDPLFFNISPKEAEMMDPRQRLFLEETWKALEDAGYSDIALEGHNCNVFVGCGPGDYNRKIAESRVTPNPYIFSGNQNSILAARISYLLNLKGPSVPIDTACSSSLVAIHLACESIRNGFCEMAIAGGSEVICTPEFLVLGSRAGMLSPVGQCKTFDETADGFVPGEAVGVVILKGLEAAVRDGDHVYGVISGSGINQDGKTNGITSPSAPAQTALECEVYDRFQINPAEITYVEAHGTGTRLGDPIEVQALTDAFRRYTSERQYCALGSVKTNIGHTLTAAGVSSVIKVLLALQHGQLPASLNFVEANRHIEFEESPFYVNTKLRDWRSMAGIKRQAAVSSFGFSGTNAHLVLKEADEPQRRAADRLGAYLVVMSAQTEEALERKIEEMATWLGREETSAPLRDIAYTLHVGRSQFNERIAIVAKTVEELEEKLEGMRRGEKTAGVYRGRKERVRQGRGVVNEDQEAELTRGSTERPMTEEQYVDRLERLAQLYVRGVETQWNELYSVEDHRRISLPTYPFAKEHYWVPKPAVSLQTGETSQTSKLHPLIDCNTSDFDEQRFTTRFTGQEFFLRDHVIENQKVLPGVCYLEMARAAGELSGKEKVGKLRHVVWSNPLTVVTEPQDVSVSLRPGVDTASYDIWTTDGEQNRVTHAQGELIYKGSKSEAVSNLVDIESIRERCIKTIDGEACYEVFRSLGFDYGKSFRVIQTLFFSGTEVLARLELPFSQSHELNEFVLHPSLLDGALQSGLWLAGIENLARARSLPFALDELRIIGSLSGVCYVHVTESTRRSGLRRFDARILDEAGQVNVEIFGYSAKTKVKPQPRAREVLPTIVSRPFEPQGRLPQGAVVDKAITNVFQRVEAGELEITAAHQLIDRLSEDEVRSFV